jgi:hypothetical protein
MPSDPLGRAGHVLVLGAEAFTGFGLALVAAPAYDRLQSPDA